MAEAAAAAAAPPKAGGAGGDDSSEYEEDEVEVVTEGLRTMERQLSAPDEEDDKGGAVSDGGKDKKQGFIARTFSRSSTGGSQGGIIRTLSRSLSKSGQGISRGLSKTGRSLSRQSFGEQEADEIEAAATKSDAYKAISSKKANTYSAPTFLFAPMGVCATMDMFAMYHNGIRQELKMAYHLLSVMERMFATLTHDEINMFSDYWEVLWAHVEDFFEAEEKVMWPAIEHKIEITHERLKPKPRGQQKAKLVLFQEHLIKDMDEKYSLMPASEAIKGIRFVINKAVASLLDYFMIMEKYLPEKMNDRFSDGEIIDIEKEIMQYMIAHGRCVWANAYIPIRWQNEPELFQKMVGRHFPRLKLLDFKRWQKTFEKQHESILKSLTEFSKNVVTGQAGSGAGTAEMVPQFYLEKAKRKAAGEGSESEAEEDDEFNT